VELDQNFRPRSPPRAKRRQVATTVSNLHKPMLAEGREKDKYGSVSSISVRIEFSRETALGNLCAGA
jgi:hypothetical protein